MTLANPASALGYQSSGPGSVYPEPGAIALRGAAVNIDAGSDPALVSAPGALLPTPAATIDGTSLAVPFGQNAAGTQPLMAFDPSGDLYAAAFDDDGNPIINEYLPGSNSPTVTLTGFTAPMALACDPGGDLFVDDNGSVMEFAAGSSSPTAPLSGISDAAALTFDSQGNLYVADPGNAAVEEFAPGSTVPTNTFSGLVTPTAMACDASGDLFVLDSGAGSNGTVYEFAAGSNSPTATLTGPSDYPVALACDSLGDLYVLNCPSPGSSSGPNGASVSMFAAGSTTPTATLSGLIGPQALAADPSGNINVLDNCYSAQGFDPSGTPQAQSAIVQFAPGSTAPTATIGLAQPGQAPMIVGPGGDICVAGVDADGNNILSVFPAGSVTPTGGGVVVYTSLSDLPINVGNTQGTGGGIDLTNAELAQISTGAAGSITIGDGSQEGNITFADAVPAATPGAATVVFQDPTGPGQIILDDSDGGTALDGNGGTVTLMPGTGGVATPLTPSGVPLATQGFDADGLTLTPTLPFAPTPGTQYTVVDNTAAPAADNPITGTFANLPQGGPLSASYDGTTYYFAANYAGGDGNDLVLTNTATPAQPQTISFASIPYQSYGSTIALAAIASSGLPVSFSVVSGPAVIDGNNLTVVGVGPITVQASQNGDADYLPAPAVNMPFTAVPARLTITANPQTKVFGAALPALTASYAGLVNGDTPASLTKQPAITTPATTASQVGTYPIIVSGAVDPDYTFTYSDSKLIILPAATTVALTTPAGPVVPGQSLTFQATVAVVSPGTGTPGGSVTFIGDKGAVLGIVRLGNTGTASLSTSFSTAGQHTVTAVYSGDANYNGNSWAINETVSPAATKTTLAASASSSVYGQTVTLTAAVAQVAPATMAPSGGTVTFYDNGAALGQAVPLGANDKATLQISTLPVGADSLTAQYNGSANFASSSPSHPAPLNVAPDKTKTTLIAAPTSAASGQSITFTATVSAALPGTATATGTVTFRNGTTSLETVALVNGQAQLRVSNLPVGTDSITVIYNGNPDFLTSTSNSVSVKVSSPPHSLAAAALMALMDDSSSDDDS